MERGGTGRNTDIKTDPVYLLIHCRVLGFKSSHACIGLVQFWMPSPKSTQLRVPHCLRTEKICNFGLVLGNLIITLPTRLEEPTNFHWPACYLYGSPDKVSGSCLLRAALQAPHCIGQRHPGGSRAPGPSQDNRGSARPQPPHSSSPAHGTTAGNRERVFKQEEETVPLCQTSGRNPGPGDCRAFPLQTAGALQDVVMATK